LRVLIVSDYAYSGGGVETFIREFIKFASDEAECQLLTWRPTALAPAWFDGRIVVDCGDVREAWTLHDDGFEDSGERCGSPPYSSARAPRQTRFRATGCRQPQTGHPHTHSSGMSRAFEKGGQRRVEVNDLSN
jgi:hypothetical protein